MRWMPKNLIGKSYATHGVGNLHPVDYFMLQTIYVIYIRIDWKQKEEIAESDLRQKINDLKRNLNNLKLSWNN